MLDDSDIDSAWWVFILSGGGWAWTIFVLIVVAVLYGVVGSNKDDCSRLHCSPGKSPRLMAHECLCVERAQ